jgi:CspA family cold shock protein
MSYKDTWETDENGNRFVFTVEMKRKLEEKGLPIEPQYVDQLQNIQPSPQVEKKSEGSDLEVAAPEVIQIDPETGKYLGTLKWYNPSRGYGFISRGGGEEIFFHKTSCNQDPSTIGEGQWLLYDVEQRSKGPEATDVELYEGDLV